MRYLLWLSLILILCACNEKAQDEKPNGTQEIKVSRTQVGALNGSLLEEASGMIASQRNRGFFWLHNDSGDEARVFLIDSTGHIHLELFLEGADNRDWEDISIYNQYVYVGDIGDNKAVRDSIRIYRFEEPNVSASATMLYDTVSAQCMSLRYQDGARDAESLMHNPEDGSLFLVSKRDSKSRVYNFDYLPDTTFVLKDFVLMDANQMTAGDVNAKGDALIKNYDQIFYFENLTSSTLMERIAAKEYQSIEYQAEPQGEAIAWDQKGEGFYTVSERRYGSTQLIYYYQIKKQ